MGSDLIVAVLLVAYIYLLVRPVGIRNGFAFRLGLLSMGGLILVRLLPLFGGDALQVAVVLGVLLELAALYLLVRTCLPEMSVTDLNLDKPGGGPKAEGLENRSAP